MRNLWIPFCVAPPLVMAGGWVHDMHARVVQLEELQSAPRVDPSVVRSIDRELEQLAVRVNTSIAALQCLASDQVKAADLDTRLAALQCELEDTTSDIEVQRSRIAEWDRLQDEIGPEALDARLDSLRRHVDQEWKGVDELAQRALGAAETAHAGMDQLAQSLQRDKGRMWKDLLGPTVQLTGEETVGSGVLLESERIEGRDEYVTYVITAWHVIRDMHATPDGVNPPIPVTIYSRTGGPRSETAQLQKYDVTLDVALLKLNTTRPVECGAKLASREHLGDVSIFEQIYAVGCPLGNDPIPTFGEIADTHHSVDGQHYWMISAPTYIGNSGGGIFDAETHELLGIFTKIYTHGTLRPTVVPHMGLATPMPAIYDWLEEVGFASLEPLAAASVKSAAAPR